MKDETVIFSPFEVLILDELTRRLVPCQRSQNPGLGQNPDRDRTEIPDPLAPNLASGSRSDCTAPAPALPA